MYKVTLADGAEVEFEGMNGSYYIVPDDVEIDSSIFTDENLLTGSVEDNDGNVTEFENWTFDSELVHRQTKKTMIALRQKSDAELEKEEQTAYITDLELALCELYELVVTE